MSGTLYPKPQALFATWLDTLATAVASDPAAAGVTQAQADRLSDANARFQPAFLAAITPSTRTPPAISEKRMLLAEAKREAKNIADIIRAAPEMTDDRLTAYGIPPRGKRAVAKPPTEGVRVFLISAGASDLCLGLAEQGSSNRRIPASAIGAVVLFHVGEDPPATTNEWNIGALTSKSKVTLRLPGTIAPGSMVWVTAYFVNRKLERGPTAATALQVRVAGHIGTPVKSMKLAA